MPTITNNLYPPIFNQSYMPAFLYISSCKVYFSISSFNSLNELKSYNNIQISVKSQKTNQSVLNNILYPSGIKIDTIQIDETRKSDDKYYIRIYQADIQGGFNLNEYYKVQLRLIGADAADPPSTGIEIDGWISSNLNYFSEWSSIALIYPISMPVLSLKNLSTSEVNTFANIDIPIIGTVTFTQQADTQTLRSYNIWIYDTNENLIEDSGQIFTNAYQNPNEINYYIHHELEENKIYALKIQILTRNLYSFEEPRTYQIKIDSTIDQELNSSLEIFTNDNLGCVKLVINAQTLNQTYEDLNWTYIPNEDTITGRSLVLSIGTGADEDTGFFRSADYVDTNQNNPILYLNNQVDYDLSRGSRLIIRRTSNTSNFKQWENIDDIIITESNVTTLEWKDYTVQPGTWYKYYIIRYAPNGSRTGCLYTEDPIMVMPQDILLQSNGQQLRVRFNPSVDSFSKHISESLVETIGSKYPFIRRNGNVGYKSFSLSGLITSFMDLTENSLEGSREEIFGNAYNLYSQYNRNNNINLFNDHVYQRQFRKKVMDFLYEDNVKLFRSVPEGNILVKLMDISFSPNQTLGRLVYSFSCTAYQIEECNLQNYYKYNIIKQKSTIDESSSKSDESGMAVVGTAIVGTDVAS